MSGLLGGIFGVCAQPFKREGDLCNFLFGAFLGLLVFGLLVLLICVFCNSQEKLFNGTVEAADTANDFYEPQRRRRNES